MDVILGSGYTEHGGECESCGVEVRHLLWVDYPDTTFEVCERCL